MTAWAVSENSLLIFSFSFSISFDSGILFSAQGAFVLQNTGFAYDEDCLRIIQTIIRL